MKPAFLLLGIASLAAAQFGGPRRGRGGQARPGRGGNRGGGRHGNDGQPGMNMNQGIGAPGSSIGGSSGLKGKGESCAASFCQPPLECQNFVCAMPGLECKSDKGCPANDVCKNGKCELPDSGPAPLQTPSLPPVPPTPTVTPTPSSAPFNNDTKPMTRYNLKPAPLRA